uniref:PX domain-containing protein n=1 Tax=Haptolina ericina TaxID=156174 RepID=A0A7S3BRP7_9EUKA|mmetsp:Transcript_6525/g.14548  ORF Transcript_6525/g.14548 Transcript_6525/m.14548 type:complete len:417 (+) Transcript_6525:88-1338(+)
MPLDISVSDPEKHGNSSVNAYVDFKVTTSTDLSRFASNDFFVRRRFRDFQWLRERLVATFPGAIVPPLPLTESIMSTDDRFSTAFIGRRKAGLELFLRRVAGHPSLSTSTDLQTFLEAKMWELQTAKSVSSSAAAVSSSWMSALLDTVTDSTSASLQIVGLRQEQRDDEHMVRLRSHAAKFSTTITAAAAAHQATVSTFEELAGDLALLGPAVNLLSQSETELSLPFTHMASALEALKNSLLSQVQQDYVSGFSLLLAYNVGMAASLKTVLQNRDRALLNYQRAQGVLEAKRHDRKQWQDANAAQENDEAQTQARPDTFYGQLMGRIDSLVDDPKKGLRLETEVAEAEAQLSETSTSWVGISEALAPEVDAFHRAKAADFARGLRSHVEHQIQFESAQQEQWIQLLSVFEQVPSAD